VFGFLTDPQIRSVYAGSLIRVNVRDSPWQAVENVALGDVKNDWAQRIIAGARRLRRAISALLLNEHHKSAGGNHHIETTLIGGNNCSQITNVLPAIDSSIAVEDLFPPGVGNGPQILLD
jgi:hypothetical protein